LLRRLLLQNKNITLDELYNNDFLMTTFDYNKSWIRELYEKYINYGVEKAVKKDLDRDDVDLFRDMSVDFMGNFSFVNAGTVKNIFKLLQTINKIYLIHKKKKITLLDLGCSVGNFINFHNSRYTFYIRGQHKKIIYTGVDINKKYINEFKSWVDLERESIKKNINIINDDVINCKLWDNCFFYDVIIAFEIIEHIDADDVGLFLNNCFEHMDANSVLFISTPVHYIKDEFLFRPIFHKHEFYYDELIKIVNDFGFEIIDEFGTFFYAECFKMWLNRKSEKIKSVYKDMLSACLPTKFVNELINLVYGEYNENLTIVCIKRGSL